MRGFNERLAVLITRGVSTMWCAYVFAALAFSSLPSALASHNPTVIVQWVSQTFLQLVLLSVIMVGQSVQASQITDLHEKTDRHHREHMAELARRTKM